MARRRSESGADDAVELAPLLVVEGAALQRLDVQADARDGGLELVRDGVQEGVLALVAADFADEEDGIQHHASYQCAEEDDAEYEVDDAGAIEQDPGDVEGDRQAGEHHAEGDGEGDGSAASGDVHALP